MKLKPGEVKCDQCEGTGFPDNNTNDDMINIFHCEKCDGYGKLDWIEAVLGKKGYYIWGQKTLKSNQVK